jgi:DNA-binding transcriptional LysR family regulator
MSITFRQFEAFRAVMLTGTTTEAARMLGVSQPGISRLISDLENEIGYNLFERVGRRVSPTPEAQLLIEEVRRAFTGLEQVAEAARDIGKARYGRLRLVSVPSASSTIVVDMIEKFSRKFPGTSVTIDVKSSDSALEWVVSQQCDLGIASSHVESPAIGSEPLQVGTSICILPAGHRLAAKSHLTLDMLEGERFVSYCSDSSFRREVDAAFKNASVERQLSHEGRTTDVVCSLVSAGFGVSIIGISAATARSRWAGAGKLVVRPVEGAPTVTLSVIWATHRPISAGAKEFLKIVRETCSTDPGSRR